MTPMDYEPIAHDRMIRARERADRWRLARDATMTTPRSGLSSIRFAVGRGLIAMGERLVDPSTYREAA